MKAIVCLAMIAGLAACTANMRQAENNIWPANPQERSAAERVFAKSQDGSLSYIPPGMEFSYRQIAYRKVLDHFEYHLDDLEGLVLLNAVRNNEASSFIRDQAYSACQDRDFRYLLDKGYDYEFRVTIHGPRKSGTESDVIGKGFCVANELPLVDQKAVDDRYSKVRYWPNGDRIDPRLIEQVMGSFQIAAAKYEPPDLNKLSIKTVETSAEGLLLSLNLEKEQKNNIKGSKYWPQHIKGQVLAKSCTSRTSLAALMMGGVYRFQVDVKFNKEIIENSAFTISYPDCFRYNKKP